MQLIKNMTSFLEFSIGIVIAFSVYLNIELWQKSSELT